MRKTIFSAAFCALCLCGSASINAQTYTQTPVTVSKEKVKGSDGKIYWSHVVLEKQTLFSIAKAYGVKVEDIIKANPDIDLKTEGLKKNAIILIPATGSTATEPQAPTVRQNESKPAKATETEVNADGKSTVHVVKWYEDLDDIALKYSIPADVLMEYNGLKSKKLKNRQKLRIPSAAEVKRLSANHPSAQPAQDSHTDTPAISTKKDKEKEDNAGSSESFHPASGVNAILMLPFNASTSKPSESNLDFYSGVLMAVKDLKEEGISIDLSTYDVAGNNMPVTTERFRASDFAIGPVNSECLGKALAAATERTYIISPLDHRTASLVPSHKNLIQAPASQEMQYNDLLRWIKSEKAGGDKVIVISEKGAAATSAISLMNRAIENSGLSCTRYSYNILEGRNAANAIASLMTHTGTNRVIINSESEAFVNDAVRNLDMLVYRKLNVVLYGQSKIRSFETIDVDNLHNLKTRISTAYYIDYDSPKVKKFLLEYRALYNTEPTQFSYQGYDLAYFFIKMKATYGTMWMEHVAAMGNTPLMQTDLLFREVGNGGYINEGIRRIVYGPDYTIRISRR